MFVCCQPLQEHPWLHSLRMPLCTPRIANLSDALDMNLLNLRGSSLETLYTKTANLRYTFGESMGHGMGVNLRQDTLDNRLKPLSMGGL